MYLRNLSVCPCVGFFGERVEVLSGTWCQDECICFNFHTLQK